MSLNLDEMRMSWMTSFGSTNKKKTLSHQEAEKGQGVKIQIDLWLSSDSITYYHNSSEKIGKLKKTFIHSITVLIDN